MPIPVSVTSTCSIALRHLRASRLRKKAGEVGGALPSFVWARRNHDIQRHNISPQVWWGASSCASAAGVSPSLASLSPILRRNERSMLWRSRMNAFELVMIMVISPRGPSLTASCGISSHQATTVTEPASVNFKALEIRLQSTFHQWRQHGSITVKQ